MLAARGFTATAEAFATYGTFAGDSAVTLPLQVPEDAIPSFGGLEVTTSSTALQELTDALLYLVRYPYECSEQIASRMIGVTALRDVLYAFRSRRAPAPSSRAWPRSAARSRPMRSTRWPASSVRTAGSGCGAPATATSRT